MAPFGVPVVPLVYCSRATSSAEGRGTDALIDLPESRSFQTIVPRTFVVSAVRDSRAFATGNLGLNVVNSLIVTLGASALIVVAGMMAAFALQVLGFRLSGFVRALFLLGIIVPVQIALVPLFIDYSRVGLLDTHLSMIIPLAAFALPMAVYLFSSFYEYIPREMYEAASLDGAGPYRIFGQITLPLSLNTIITVVLVNSIFIWNDFIFANTFVLSDGLKTIPLGLQNYIGAMGNTDWTATFAAEARERSLRRSAVLP